MPTSQGEIPSWAVNVSRWYCACESFGCGKRKNLEDDPACPNGVYLGSEREYREHRRADKRKRTLASYSRPGDVEVVMSTESAPVLGYTDLRTVEVIENDVPADISVSTKTATPVEIYEETTPNASPWLREQETSLKLNRYKTIFIGYRDISLVYPTLSVHFDKYTIERLRRYENILGDIEVSIKNLINLKDSDASSKDDVLSEIEIEINRLRESRSASGLGLLIDTSKYKNSLQALSHFKPIVLGCYILVANLHINCGMSLKNSKLVTQSLKNLLQISFNINSKMTVRADIDRILLEIPKDARTILKRLDLTPSIKRLICCSACFACYLSDDCPSHCVYKLSKTSKPCNNALFKSKRKKLQAVPVREYSYHKLKEWLGELLWREGIEELLDNDLFDRNEVPSGRAMNDVWDGKFFREFKGPDGELFVGSESRKSEGRLVFSLSMDGFNPFSNKIAGKRASVGAIYLVCLNLPPAIRYNPENIFVAGVIPGPGSPHQGELDHLLKPLIDELLPFWYNGVYYSETPRYRNGRLFRCAVVLVVSDLPAARQLTGFNSHSAKSFCSLCHITLAEIDEIQIVAAEKRSGEEQHFHGQRWLWAESEKAKDHIYEEYGQRFPELFRLPYFNTVRFTVVDPMHALLLGVLERHCRVVWQQDAKLQDGEGEDNSTSSAITTRVSDAQMKKGLDVFKNGSLKDLKSLNAAILSKIARAYNLRYGGSAAHLQETLKNYRISCGGFDELGDKRIAGENVIDREIDIRASADDASLLLEFAQIASRKDLNCLTRELLITICKNNYDGLQAGAENYAKTLKKKKKSELIDEIVIWRLEKRPKSLEREEADNPPSVIEDSEANPPIISEESEADFSSVIEDSEVDSSSIIEDPEAISSSRIEDSGADSSSTEAKSYRSKKILQKLTHAVTVVLGKTTLKEIWTDMDATILPSWLQPAPHHIGDGSHGKLKADQWRTYFTVHLVITLIRLWGHLPEEDRRYRLLLNFLHLTTAVKIVLMRRMTPERIELYNENMMLYLEELKELFPGIALSPNNHLSLHLGSMLEDYGPTHSWRSFATERFNYILQQTSSNNRFGELENTLLKRFCMSQSLQHLLRMKCLPDSLQQLITTFDDHRRDASNHKGTLINDINAFCSNFRDDSRKKQKRRAQKDTQLNESTLSLLRHHLESIYPGGHGCIWERAVHLKSVSICGIYYSTHRTSYRDCYAVIGDLNNHWDACRIEDIFTHSRDPDDDNTLMTYFLIRRYRDLTPQDAQFDIYRRFPLVAGKLCYDEFEGDLRLIEANRSLCHFALTPYSTDRIQMKCVHILPLNRD